MARAMWRSWSLLAMSRRLHYVLVGRCTGLRHLGSKPPTWPVAPVVPEMSSAAQPAISSRYCRQRARRRTIHRASCSYIGSVTGCRSRRFHRRLLPGSCSPHPVGTCLVALPQEGSEPCKRATMNEVGRTFVIRPAARTSLRHPLRRVEGIGPPPKCPRSHCLWRHYPS